MIRKRKTDHLRICIEMDVESGLTGLERYRLKHKALPEVDLGKIDTSVSFLKKKLEYPFIIEAMSGGNKEGELVNKVMAKAAQKYGLGLGVGSQRAAIENPELEETYQIRDVAPDIYLIANLGAVQLNYGYGAKEYKKAIKMIKADALALHLNPLQEAIQPEGDQDFSDLIKKINSLAKKIDKPLIIKGVGSGISFDEAKKLKVSAFDTGGVGGTSWSIIEGMRRDEETRSISESFSGWGIPTAECITSLDKLGKPLIASGGIRTGIDIAKSIALGANLTGSALPLLRWYYKDGEKGVSNYLEKIFSELRISMFLTGSSNIKELDGKIELLQ